MAVSDIKYTKMLDDSWLTSQLKRARSANFLLNSASRVNTYTDPLPLPEPRVVKRVLKQETDTTQPVTTEPVSTPVSTTTTSTNPTTSTTTKPSGQHVFKHKGMKVGKMQALLDEAAKYGIYFRVTSGLRPGAKTKKGNTSHHSLGNAIDVTPIEGQTYADLTQQIKNSPEFVKWMQDHGYGIYDETTPEVMAKTGATGAHWHIGPDKVAIAGLQKIIA